MARLPISLFFRSATKEVAQEVERYVPRFVAPAAPVSSMARQPYQKPKDWSIPLLLGGGAIGYAGLSPSGAPSTPPTPEEEAAKRRVPIGTGTTARDPLAGAFSNPSLDVIDTEPAASDEPGLSVFKKIIAQQRERSKAATPQFVAAETPARNHFDQYDAAGDESKPVDAWLKEGIPATFAERFKGTSQ